MRRAALALIVTACSFDPSGQPNGPGSIDATPGTPDARIVPDAPPGTPDAPPTAAPCPTDPDLVACWRFESNDASIEPLDDTPNANDGTSSGVTFIASLAGHGLAMSFSPNASAMVPQTASLDPAALTVEMWVYARSLPPSNGRAGLLDNNGNYGLFLAPDGTVRCVIGSVTDISLAIPTAQWTHVACTYDGSKITLYQDGVAGGSVSDAFGVPTTGTGGVGIGQNAPSDDHLDGALDDVRVWQVARGKKDLCIDAAPNC
jgi:hypothetical protein